MNLFPFSLSLSIVVPLNTFNEGFWSLVSSIPKVRVPSRGHGSVHILLTEPKVRGPSHGHGKVDMLLMDALHGSELAGLIGNLSEPFSIDLHGTPEELLGGR